MATYHVFIERPRDGGTTAAARLANAVAERYGIPAATLVERLAAGRLRVKTGVDRATAEEFAADLEQLGAVCSIVDAATNEVVSTPPKAPPVAPPVAPPKPAPARSTAPSSSPFSSALSAARTGADAQPQDLGALSSGEFALATLDGADDHAGASGGFAPPGADHDHLPASMGPAIAPAAPIAPVSFAPVDAFAPPEAEAELMLDVDTRPAKPVGTTAPVAPPPQTMARSAEDDPPPPRGPGLAGWIRDARMRFAGGVLIAILLGFVPASLVTSMREGPAFAEIDKELAASYGRVEDERDWLRLEETRAQALAHKQETRRDIALASILLWALVAGGIAFVWFRVIDWDALAARF